MRYKTSKDFWDRAARENAAWHVATGYNSEDPAFFESGRREVDYYLHLAGLTIRKTDSVLEIGSGVGRMTRHLATLAGKVVASDVSAAMLARARANLSETTNVEFLEVPGDGKLPIEDSSVDAVFSYITMQHVPSAEAQETYFSESLRVLAPGGWAYIQFRRSGLAPRALDWVGHLAHLPRGRRTLSKAWRGSRVRESHLRAYASDAVTVDILPLGRRHIWVLARKRKN